MDDFRDIREPENKKKKKIGVILSFSKRHVYLITALLVVVLLITVLFKCFYPNRYKWIVIHHSASSHDNLTSIRNFHNQQHGWLEAGYHLILSNGSTNIPTGHLEATNRYRLSSYSMASRNPKYNLRGIHLCVIGNYENSSPTESIKSSMVSAIILLQKKYRIPDEHILLHRDIGQTLCPGKHITKEQILFWKSVHRKFSDEIRSQHESVIGI
jgi:hypothetical protein